MHCLLFRYPRKKQIAWISEIRALYNPMLTILMFFKHNARKIGSEICMVTLQFSGLLVSVADSG